MSPLALSLRFLQTLSDAQLAKLAGEGHERAFEALVRRYRKPLLAYCRRMTSSEASAEDALQQGLLQAWTAIHTGAEVRDPRAWLYRIVHNVAISSRRRLGPIPVEIEDTVCANGADHEAERRMAAREALEGLAALPEMQRDVLVSTAVDGLSHEEVADALGLSSGAVRGLVYRARAALRAAGAAVLPGPLIGWSLRGAERGGSPGLAEALAGGGSAGLGALLVKGGAIAVTAGAIATAGIAADEDHHRAHRAGDEAGTAAHRQSGSRPGAPTLAHDKLVADSTGRAPGTTHRGSGGSDERGSAAKPGDDSGGHGGRGSGRGHASDDGGRTGGGPGPSSGRDDGGSQSGPGGSGASGESGASSGSGRSGGDSGDRGGSSGSGSSSGSGTGSSGRGSAGIGSSPGGPGGGSGGSSGPGGGELATTTTPTAGPLSSASSSGGPPAATTTAASTSGGGGPDGGGSNDGGGSSGGGSGRGGDRGPNRH